MFANTLCLLPNIQYLWKGEDSGIVHAYRFGLKSRLTQIHLQKLCDRACPSRSEDCWCIPTNSDVFRRAGRWSFPEAAVGRPSERITHALVKGSTLGVGGIRHRGSAGCEKPGMPSRCARHAPKIWFQAIMSRFGCVRLSLMVDNATASICTKCC